MSAPVSVHAVVRWLERVRGVDIEAIRRAHPDAIEVAIARIAAARLGLTLTEAFEAVLPTRLHFLVAFQPTTIRRAGFDLVCTDGVVVTVTEARESRERIGGLPPRRRPRKAARRSAGRQRTDLRGIVEGWEAAP